MDFELSEHHLVLQRMVRDFAEKEIEPVVAQFDEDERFPIEIIQKMGELGLLGLPFPEKYGGGGGDHLSYAILLEELGRVDLGIALTVDADCTLAGFPLNYFGSEEQKQKWLVPLAQGKILGCFGLTEPGAGSDAGGSMATTAVLEGDEWVINGSKTFITNAGAPNCTFCVVAAVTGKRADGKKEISNFIVPQGTPGFSISKPYQKLGVRTSDTRELSFDNCRVPRENLVGEKGAGFRQFLATLDEGRLTIAAMSVGMAQRCLELSTKYAKERVQFGQPIFNFQATQFKLSDMAVNVELARLITYKAAWLEDQGKPYTKEVAMAKLFASEIAQKAAADAVQIHGGIGFTKEYPVERFYRDCRLLTIGEGTSEVMRLIIARHL